MLTKEEKLTILAAKEDSAFKTMAEVQPTDDDFFKGIQAVHAIRQLAEVVAYTDELGAMLTAMQKAGAPEPEEELPGQITVVDDIVAAAEPDVTVAEVTMTKSEMRVELSELGRQGLNVAELLNSMGYAKLSEVPEAQYAELLRKAKEAL